MTVSRHDVSILLTSNKPGLSATCLCSAPRARHSRHSAWGSLPHAPPGTPVRSRPLILAQDAAMRAGSLQRGIGSPHVEQPASLRRIRRRDRLLQEDRAARTPWGTVRDGPGSPGIAPEFYRNAPSTSLSSCPQGALDRSALHVAKRDLQARERGRVTRAPDIVMSWISQRIVNARTLPMPGTERSR